MPWDAVSPFLGAINPNAKLQGCSGCSLTGGHWQLPATSIVFKVTPRMEQKWQAFCQAPSCTVFPRGTLISGSCLASRSLQQGSRGGLQGLPTCQRSTFQPSHSEPPGYWGLAPLGYWGVTPLCWFHCDWVGPIHLEEVSPMGRYHLTEELWFIALSSHPRTTIFSLQKYPLLCQWSKSKKNVRLSIYSTQSWYRSTYTIIKVQEKRIPV